METKNEFTVNVPIEHAWAVLTDLGVVAPCLPGAQLTGQEGNTYTGKVRIKVGPVVSEYAGTAEFTEKDEARYRAVIEARGRSSTGAGSASAHITAGFGPTARTRSCRSTRTGALPARWRSSKNWPSRKCRRS